MSHIKLSEKERLYLESLLSKGICSARIYKRASSLLYLDKGLKYIEVHRLLKVRYATVLAWSKRYKAEGLGLLKDKPKSGRPPQISGSAKAKITALACSTPPLGYAKWSLRLLADKIVSLEIVDQISHTEVGNILKKTNCNLT